jgi:hypothetical protein
MIAVVSAFDVRLCFGCLLLATTILLLIWREKKKDDG